MTTIDLRRTLGRDLQTTGEKTPDESERGEANTPRARIPEVNHDRPMEKDMWHLKFNFRRKHSG
jgi:hypothetical protein